MKLSIALAAAMLALAPAAAYAQSSSDTGRGAGDKAVGPASQNGDTSTSNTKAPGSMGRSAYPDSARPSMPPSSADVISPKDMDKTPAR